MNKKQGEIPRDVGTVSKRERVTHEVTKMRETDKTNRSMKIKI